jgi:hypothetical protein
MALKLPDGAAFCRLARAKAQIESPFRLFPEWHRASSNILACSCAEMCGYLPIFTVVHLLLFDRLLIERTGRFGECPTTQRGRDND